MGEALSGLPVGVHEFTKMATDGRSGDLVVWSSISVQDVGGIP